MKKAMIFTAVAKVILWGSFSAHAADLPSTGSANKAADIVCDTEQACEKLAAPIQAQIDALEAKEKRTKKE